LVAPPIMDELGDGLCPIGMDAIRECPPYGMYLLHAYLSAHGHEVVLADLIAPGTDRLDEYSLSDVGLVGIGATSMSWPTALSVIAQVRERSPLMPIVVGGIHPTMFDWYVLSTFDVNYVVRGEGEKALVALTDALERGELPDQVPNLTWRTPNAHIIRNPPGLKISAEELAESPVPDYSRLPVGVYQGLSIESSRGCGFDCSFCSTSYRRSYRGIEPSKFVDRLESVLVHQERTIQPFTHIIDDEFSMNPRRAIAVAEEITRRGVTPNLVYDSRATDLLFPGMVESMRPYTYQFLVGAECGYDEGLERIGKGTTTDILRRAAETLHDYGISNRADFSFILGLPWETVREVKKTCQFALSLYERYGVRLLLQWYCQIPGSRLWQTSRECGEVTEAMYNRYGFFRDLYLFRSGVKLSNSEIEEISRLVGLAQDLARLQDNGRSMIEYSHPEPIRICFPSWITRRESDSLANLREVAMVGRRGQPIGKPEDLGAPEPWAAFSLTERHERPLRHIAPHK